MAQASKKRAAETPVIPDRLYFKISDVAELCGVANSVLRFWETQFPQLKPNKSGTGQRLYRRRDVELALEIKRLVHGEGFTIAGARQVLESGGRRNAASPAAAAPASSPVEVPAHAPVAMAPQAALSNDARTALAQMKAELREIASLLASPSVSTPATAAAPAAPDQPAAPRKDRVRVMKPRSDIGSLFEV